MKIALINPGVESYSGTLPPLGVLYIASVLEKRGFTVKIFDAYPYDDRDIPGLIDFRPDVIGITILTDYLVRARHIVDIIHRHLPEPVLIIGGVHVTVLSEESMRIFSADIGVIGEGEYTLLELCSRLSDNLNWKDVKGIIFPDNNASFVRTPPRSYIENLDDLPLPARHLIDFRKYLVPPGIIRGHWSERSTTIMASRGCPFSCIWCGSQCTFGRKVRYRTVDNVLSEIESLIENFSVDAIWFVDDTFTLEKARVIEFCKKIVSRKIRLAWGCQAHVKTADEEMFGVMKNAGLVQLDFGVESGSDRVLRGLNKNSDAKSIRKAFDIARRVGVRTCATFMFGSPQEKEDDVEETFKLAKEINPNFTSSFFITPYPGTELMAKVKEESWQMSGDRSGRGLKKRPMLRIYFSEEELLRIRRRFQGIFAFRNFSSLFFSPGYLVSALRLLLRYPKGVLYGIRAFVKSFVIDDFFFAFINYYISVNRVSR